MLDPIARHDFMAAVLLAAADDGVSVLLSSHVLAELERVADYLVMMSQGRVQMAGEVDDLLAGHRVLTGPAAQAAQYTDRPVVHIRRAGSAGAPGGSRDRATIRFRPAGRHIPSAWKSCPCVSARTRRHRVARPGTRPQRRTVGGDEMTALAVPVRLENDTNLRPLPWRRMGWVIWRQHRIALAGAAVFLGTVAALVWTAGRQLHHTHAAIIACNPSSPVCPR